MGTKVSTSHFREPPEGERRYRVNSKLLPEPSTERNRDLRVGLTGFSRYREAALDDAGRAGVYAKKSGTAEVFFRLFILKYFEYFG